MAAAAPSPTFPLVLGRVGLLGWPAASFMEDDLIWIRSIEDRIDRKEGERGYIRAIHHRTVRFEEAFNLISLGGGSEYNIYELLGANSTKKV